MLEYTSFFCIAATEGSSHKCKEAWKKLHNSYKKRSGQWE